MTPYIKFEDIIFYIESHIERADYSHRGGGIEVSLGDMLEDLGAQLPESLVDKYRLEDLKMIAFCNYLGGGMLGSVQSDKNFDPISLFNKEIALTINKFEHLLKRYFYNLITNDNEYAPSYSQNQLLPNSAY